MKDKMNNNLKLKIIAVLFATGLWMISININDPYQSKDYSVNVQLLNINNLTSAGKYVEVINNSDEISVRVRGNRSVMDNFNASNIMATADLNEMDHNNQVPIKLTTIKTSGSKIESIRSSDTYLEVRVEDIKKIQKSLEVVTKNVPEDGYMLGKVTTEQNALKISGPDSAVALVDKAVVNFDLAGATDDVSMILPIELYDKEGNKIQDNRLTMSLKEVQCVATVLATKEVPLIATVKGTPAKGYAHTSEIICEPTNVVVAAKAGVLRGVKEIALKDVVDLAKATQNVEAVVDIRDYLPENVILADAAFDGKVKIVANVAETFTEEVAIPVERIQIVNVPDGIKVELKEKKENLTLNVGGFASEKEGFSEDDIKVKVDVLGYMNKENIMDLPAGTYTLDVTLELPEGVWTDASFQAEVKVSKK